MVHIYAFFISFLLSVQTNAQLLNSWIAKIWENSKLVYFRIYCCDLNADDLELLEILKKEILVSFLPAVWSTWSNQAITVLFERGREWHSIITPHSIHRCPGNDHGPGAQKVQPYGIQNPFFIYVFNRIAGRYISLGVTAFCIGLSLPWPWWSVRSPGIGLFMDISFGNFLFHLPLPGAQSTPVLVPAFHPSCPGANELSVTTPILFLEGPLCRFYPYVDLYLFGVSLWCCSWSCLLMAPGAAYPRGREFHERLTIRISRSSYSHALLITRVHHGPQPIVHGYQLLQPLNVWDRIFKTYQPEQPKFPIEYESHARSTPEFFRCLFWRILYLGKDVVGHRE